VLCWCLVLLLSCLQDLSVGKLDCTPDPIFSYTTYTLQDLQDIMPAQVRKHRPFLFVSYLCLSPSCSSACMTGMLLRVLGAWHTPAQCSNPALQFTAKICHLFVCMQVLELARVAAQQLPQAIVSQVVALQVVMRPVAVHAMVLAVFASLVAPFGEQRGS
jgi:hypothetical protein